MTLRCSGCGRGFETTKESGGGTYCPSCWKNKRNVLVRGFLSEMRSRFPRNHLRG
jgi:DNA-directed RNA polymerase subunit RPC12/RpoP